MQPSVLKLEYQFSGRRFFDVCEASALRTALEWFGECQELISGGGRKPFPKPSAFESEIHPTHKPSVYAPGISPCRGQIHASVNLYSPKKPDCIYPCRPEDGRIDGAAAYGYISGQMCSIAEGTSQNKAPCGCQKATAVDCPDTGIGSQTAVL